MVMIPPQMWPMLMKFGMQAMGGGGQGGGQSPAFMQGMSQGMSGPPMGLLPMLAKNPDMAKEMVPGLIPKAVMGAMDK